jgi:hypothetical protein
MKTHKRDSFSVETQEKVLSFLHSKHHKRILIAGLTGGPALDIERGRYHDLLRLRRVLRVCKQ